MKLESVEIPAPAKHDATVFWLHGLGADGHDFEAIVPALRLPDSHGIRFVFPHAPMRSITINNGMVMRGWYDVRELALERIEDSEGIEESSGWLGDEVAAEIEGGIDAQRIILAGFSQGGAVALHCGVRQPRPLGGIMALSTYLPLEDRFDAERSEAALTTPVFMAHGRIDPLIPMVLGRRSRDRLTSAGYAVEWHDYPMQHAVCPEEIEHLALWLVGRLLTF